MPKELHARYAPILRFSRGENFFPMTVDDFLGYSALYSKGRKNPLLEAGAIEAVDLSRRRFRSQDVFLRSVNAGPMLGIEVAAGWGKDTLALIQNYVRNPAVFWSESAARAAYQWFSAKTESATKHFWWNSLILPRAEDDQRAGVRGDLPRLILPGEVRRSAIERYQESQGDRPNYAYYYRLVERQGYLILQYWFFYAYNDWANGFGGFNDHEGDWEGFHLFFRLDGGKPVEPPAFVCYLGHHSRITKPWGHPDLEIIGTHPVVNVAAGSHASYPERKQYPLMALYNLIDYATGDALTLDHHDWRSRLELEKQPWLDRYRGSWGTRYWLPVQWLRLAMGSLRALLPAEISLPGVSGPRGPKFEDDGEERTVWNDPLIFAGIAEA